MHRGIHSWCALKALHFTSIGTPLVRSPPRIEITPRDETTGCSFNPHTPQATTLLTVHPSASPLASIQDNLERWRNHYSRSTIGSLSYVTSPLDVVTATGPPNASFTSNTDPGRRKNPTFLAANGPSCSRQSRPRRRCWICGWEYSHGSQEEAAKVGDGGVLRIPNQPVGLPRTGYTGVSLRPASAAAAEGCWFCHAGEAVGEKPAGLGADFRDVMAAPIATVGGQVRSSGGPAPFDGRADRPKVGDIHNGSAERRLEVSAEMQAEIGMANRVEAHVGMQASTRSGVNNVGEKRDRREARVTICAAEGLSGGSTNGRDQGASEQQLSAGECRGNGGRLAGRGLSESLVDDGLATLRSGRHRRFQERWRHRQHGPVIRAASLKKGGFIEGASSGDIANLGGREGGGGYEGEKRSSTKADDKIGRKSFPQSGPRGGSSPIREAACSVDERSRGRSPSDAQAGGAFFGDPLCWEEGGVWWFRPRVYDATHDSHAAVVVVSPEYR